MNRAIVGGFLALLVLVPSVHAQQTKTFDEAKCTYTLPGEDWDWLDPQLVPSPSGKTLALARNQKGIAFTLRSHEVKASEKPSARAYESFEKGLLESSGLKKLGGKHLTFKGIPSYQIDVQTSTGAGSSIRVFYANNLFYYLQVANAAGPLDPADADPVFQGFSFVGQPQAMVASGDDSAFERGREAGKAVGSLVVVLVVVGVVIWLVSRSRRGNRQAPPLDRGPPRL